MLNTFFKATLLGGLLLCSVQAGAVEVNRLNEADVPVASRGSAELEQAIKDALAKVFVKNSGSQDALSAPQVKDMIGHARTVLSQFGYVENNGQLYVRASFDSGRVISALRGAQLPVWGKQRPLTLIWLATDGESEKILLGDQSELPLRGQFNDASAQVGVPLLFPLLDLDDLMLANINSVRGFFPDELASASRRYQSDFFALVTLDAATTGFDYRVALYPRVADDAEPSQLQAVNEVSGNAADADSAIAAILSGMSSFYVSQYAVTASGPATDTELVFTGIASLKSVVDIETYLGQLSMIKNARLIAIQGDTVRFGISLFGSEDELRRTLALEPRLSPDSTAGSDGASAPITDPFANAINPGDVIAAPGQPVMGNRYRWRGQ